MDLFDHPRARDLVLICLQPNQNARQLKLIEKEAKTLYKKVKKATNNMYQTGLWDNMRVIDYAASGGHELLLNTLVTHLHVNPKIPDADCNRTPLHHAAQAGHNSIVESLVTKHSYPLDAVDVCGSTPLNIAIFNGRDTTVDLLLDYGASTEGKNFFGSPMHYAAYVGNTHVVKKLHGVNADLANVVEFGFCTPAGAAVCSGSLYCIEFLAEVTDTTGISLLYKVVSYECSEDRALDRVYALLRFGANANLQDEGLMEELPIIMAAKRGWREVVELLLNHTDPIAGLDWSVDGLIGHVNTHEFKEMDEVQKVMRINHLKGRILEELHNRHYLAAEMMCRMLRFDLDKATFHSWTCCLCEVIRKFAEVSTPLGCTTDDLLHVGWYMLNTEQIDSALVAANACMVLGPEDEECIRLHRSVTEAYEGTSSSGRR